MNVSKFSVKWLIVILLISLLKIEPVSGQEKISLFQCYEWGRNNYPQICQYGLIDQAEQYNLSNAGKGWYPQITLNGKVSYQSDVTKLPFDSEEISSIIPSFNIPTLSKDQYQVTAELSQTIWDGGVIHSTRELSRAEATANREQLESNLYVLNDRVNQLYFGCLLQDELIKQNTLLQQELRINIDRIVAMINNGVANQSDRESLEVELLNAQQNEIELKASRSAYRQMLGALTGKLLFEDTVLETPNFSTTNLSTTINRPELRVLDAKGKLFETQNKLVTVGIMPRVNAFVQVGYGRPGLNMLEDSFEPYYIAGVRFSWNLGKLYTMKNDRRKIDVNMRNINMQRETFLFNTNLQMIQQDTEIRKITGLMRADEEIIRLRTSIKKAAEVKLENGVISVTDLIREINAEDMAKQIGTTHHIQQLMAISTYLYTTNNIKNR